MVTGSLSSRFVDIDHAEKGEKQKERQGQGKRKGEEGQGKERVRLYTSLVRQTYIQFFCRKKSGDKPDKETILKEALATAKLWEARYTAVDHSRQQYRDQALRLVGENDTLQSAINKTEKDTIEVRIIA